MNSGLVSGLVSAPLRTSFIKNSIYGTVVSPFGNKVSPIILSPQGSRGLILGPVPDGSTRGGSPRSFGIDLQTYRAASTQIAGDSGGDPGSVNITIGASNTATAQPVNNSGNIGIGWGNYSNAGGCFILLGKNNSTGTGGSNAFLAGNANTGSTNSFVIGDGCSATYINLVTGRAATGRYYGVRCHKGLTNGQIAEISLNATTTNETPTALIIRTIFGDQNISIPSGIVYSGFLTVLGIKSNGTAEASFRRFIVIKNVAGTTTLVESSTIGTDIVGGTGGISVTANDSNDSLSIQVTGIISETWRWFGRFDIIDLAYGT